MRGTLLGVFLGQTDLVKSKMQCTANHTSYRDDGRHLKKEGALGEAVRQAQGLTKRKKRSSASVGAGFLEISMTQRQLRYLLPQ